MKNDIIYECLSDDQIDALEIYGEVKKTAVLDLIDDLHNAGMEIHDAIKLSFDALKEYEHDLASRYRDMKGVK